MPYPMKPTLVIVSGGDAVSPFTTPDGGCARGLSAGNTDTFLREELIAAGYDVYTAPAMNVPGVVAEPDPASFGAFGDCPITLPAELTIQSTGDIDEAGTCLARFISYLHDKYGVQDLVLVAHSNGGLYSVSATRQLIEQTAPVKVRALVTLGTPWTGTVPLRVLAGEVPESEIAGDPRATALLEGMREEMRTGGEPVLGRQDTYAYLRGDEGWLARQAGVLDGVPTLLIGGSALTREGGAPDVWPFDGLVSAHAATGQLVDENVIPMRETGVYPLVHSIFIADQLGMPWEMGMTWNPDVLARVVAFLARIGS